jgi:hypothetical protein
MATTDGTPNGVNPEFNEFLNFAGDTTEAKIQSAVKNKKQVSKLLTTRFDDVAAVLHKLSQII